MKTFRDLLMWKKAMVLVTECYKICQHFPKEEMFALASQLKRCSISVPSNIAEGFGRDSKKEYCRFLNIAMGSVFELQTQIEIAYNLEYITKSQFEEIYDKSRELERMLGAYIKKIRITLNQ